MSGDKYKGLKKYEFEILSTYNSEKNRGIRHTTGWRDKMAILQRRWDHHGHLNIYGGSNA